MKQLGLILLSIVVICASDVALDKDQTPPIHICRPKGNQTNERQALPIQNKQGGPVMAAPVVYLIFYGSWTHNDKNNVLNFVKNLGATPWWSLNVQYGAGIINFGGYSTDPFYSRGLSFDGSQIFGIITDALNDNKLPRDANGIYMVLTSSDVTIPNFCTQFCGWHSYDYVTMFKYSFVGVPYHRCPCYTENLSPNGNPYVDAMMSVIAHELAETATDPLINAWKDANGDENADKCAWNYLNFSLAPNGAKYNVHVGQKRYYIQSNWNLRTQQCALQDDGFPLLSPNQRIYSSNKFYFLTLQSDYNLVIYRSSDNFVVWSSLTRNSGAIKATFLSNGNFVLTNQNNQVVWSTNTFGNPGAYMNLEDDGNLIIYTSADRGVWASNANKGTGWQMIIGGYNFSSSFSSVKLYNYKTRQLCQIPNLPVKVYGHFGTVMNGIPIYCGGEDVFGYYSECYQMNTATKTWTKMSATLPYHESSASQVFVPNVGWLVYKDLYQTLRLAMKLPSLNSTWISGPRLPTDVYFGQCVVQISDTRTAFIGGASNPGQISVFDWTTLTYTVQASTFSQSRGRTACVLMKGVKGEPLVVVFAGGYNEKGGTESWNPATGEIQMRMPDFPGPLQFTNANPQAVVVEDGKAVIFYKENKPTIDIWKYVYATNTWSRIDQFSEFRTLFIVLPVDGIIQC